jgi:hypothetical protein
VVLKLLDGRSGQRYVSNSSSSFRIRKLLDFTHAVCLSWRCWDAIKVDYKGLIAPLRLPVTAIQSQKQLNG